jgi:hypothetical protein
VAMDAEWPSAAFNSSKEEKRCTDLMASALEWLTNVRYRRCSGSVQGRCGIGPAPPACGS